MQKLIDLLTLREEQTSYKTVLLFVLIAWIFGIAARMIWVYQHHDIPEYRWAGQIMINTNDGYYWAEGARDRLENPAVTDELSPVSRAVPVITAVIAKLLPFVSFETLILYLPAVLGSLIVVPIILIGRALNHTGVGFAASLIAVIAWSYYNRTMVGYYDDDMLVIVLPMLVLWSLIWGVRQHENRYLIAVLAATLLSHWYYPGSYSLHFAMSAMLLLYTLAFHRNVLFNYKLLGFSLIAFAYTALWIKLGVALIALAVFMILKEKADRFTFVFLAIAAGFVLLTGGFNPILYQLDSYVFRQAVAAELPNLQFFNVVQTVREAGAIGFDVFSGRISGHWAIFLAACAGTAMMMLRHRVMLLALPFVGLGFLAYGIPGLIPGAGLRFTIYAVPVLALGFAYLAFWAGERFSDRRAQMGIVSALTALALWPNITHIIDYRVPTVFNSHEVAALDALKSRAQPRKDYAIGWWDYGYPIRYYSYAKTLADGGKHRGEDNFAPSFILSAPSQLAAARMARLSVEYTERQFAQKWRHPIVAQMMADHRTGDPAAFLNALGQPQFDLPEKTRDVYIVLPYRMADIFSTVMLFSSLDLASGRQYPTPFFAHVRGYQESNEAIMLGNGMIVHKQNGQLQIGQQRVPIRHFITTGYDNQGKHLLRSQTLNQSGPLSVIFFAHLGTFWIVDDNTLRSPFVQLFALESFDPNLFEPAVMTPMMKIFKLKL